jgi:hypothetical protein
MMATLSGVRAQAASQKKPIARRLTSAEHRLKIGLVPRFPKYIIAIRSEARLGGNPMIRTTLRRIGYGLFATLALFAYAGQAEAVEAERFEITSLKAPRAALVDTIAALQKGDIAGAIATRYDKLARNFLAAVQLVAAIILLN